MIAADRQSFLSGYKRDYYGGALMVLIGLGAVMQGRTYHVGTLVRMGSGFFPVSLGVILTIIGIAIAGGARRRQSAAPAHPGVAAPEDRRPEWRGWICILSSVAAFAILGRWGGLLLATFAISFISAMGDRDNTWRSALVLALIMSVIALVVFWWALQIQFPLFNWD